MDMKILALGALVGLSPATQAEEGDFEAAGRHPSMCWNVGIDQIEIGATVEMSIELESGTVGSVDVVAYTPDTAVGYEAAQAAVRAVKDCAPYVGMNGNFEVTFDAGAEPDIDESIPLPGAQSN